MRTLLVLAVLTLSGLSSVARAAVWPDAPFPAPTDAEVVGVSQSIQQACPTMAIRLSMAPRCPAAVPSLPEGRRIVELGMLGGALEWCGEITHRASLAQTRVRSDGSSWDDDTSILFIPGLHGAAKARGKALMQGIAPGGCSQAQTIEVRAAFDQYLAGDASPEAKRRLTAPARPWSWPLLLLSRPTDAQVVAFVFAAEGCPAPLLSEYGQGPKDNGAACEHGLNLSLGEARRIVELGLVSGAVRWCDPHPDVVNAFSPWMVTLGQVSMTSAGTLWDPTIGQMPSFLHGMSQGWARRQLGSRGKTCSSADRAAASQAMLALVQQDALGGALARPKPGDIILGPDGKQTVFK